MNRVRTGAVRSVGPLLNLVGVLLLVLGAAAGWLVPRSGLLSPLDGLTRQLASSPIDRSGFLGADITALAVLIAVVIGFNVTILQIAGQAHSLNVTRGILATLTPFLLCWSLTTAIALAYFLVPPIYVGQLWQLYAWFGAIVLLMIGYLWDLPWRLSGDYVARWALSRLRQSPVADWETLEGYAVLQTAIAAAGARGDLGNVRAMTLRLGRFLVDARDRRAEAANQYDRRRYRSLKSLLSGCSQGAAEAPNAVAYYLGYVLAGVLLQATAVGHPPDDAEHDLFTGVLRSTRGSPEHLNPLWTGMRHALCRPVDRGVPYLLKYWLGHDTWPADDPRRVTRLAVALARLHAAYWRELCRAATEHEAAAQAAEMAISLYRDISAYLGVAVARAPKQSRVVRLPDLPLALLDETHACIMHDWGVGNAESGVRVDVVNSYEAHRARLGASTTRVAV